MIKFAERLRKARQKKSISQEHLAYLLEVDQKSVSRWENDDSETSFDNLYKLSQVLECSVLYLLGLED